MMRPAMQMAVQKPTPTAIVRTVLVAALALGLASPAHAQDDAERSDVDFPGLRIEASAGWDGVVDRSAPVPVSFLIHNDTDRQIEGQLWLSDPGGNHDVSLGEVVVSAGTARRLTAIRAMQDWDECYATFRDGRDIRWRRELPVASGGEFNLNVNFVLFVDDGGRRLQLPAEAAGGAAAYGSSDFITAGEAGRPVKCLSAATWQLPNHPGPLIPIQALIFPEAAVDEVINDVQWRAIAEWICEGGVVFLHKESETILQRLAATTPLAPEPAVLEGEYMVRRIGLGAIYQYDDPILPSAGSDMRTSLGETVAKLPRQHVTHFLNAANRHFGRGGQADRNRAMVALFFACYTLFIGIIPFVLFRLSRKRIAGYAIVIVVGASILSGVIGGYLRYSRGDLHWATVTQAGAGGVVQVAMIDVQSAGGRNTQVAVQGANADLQFTQFSRNHYNARYYGWNQASNAYSPFTWQPDLTPELEDTYQVNVAMTPWGRRTLQATAFQRTIPALDFELKFEPLNVSSQSGNPGVPDLPIGQFSLKINNRLPFALKQAQLVIAITREVGSYSGLPPGVEISIGGGTRQGGPQNQVVEFYQHASIPRIAADATHQQSIGSNFQVLQNQWNQMLHFGRGYVQPPRISQMGAASAWIVAEIEESPILAIDAQRSDFDPREQQHLFVQEIRPEDMPDLLGSPATSAQSPETTDAEPSSE